ncbi:RNA polymerase sigma factor [Hydrogenophaga sp. OTU3427]|uniref:RNA polymerase sigma factor n=1 Tax=Hydrogenophaga sp. OTU3427 TaxID=3043856 RepID=UPI00313CC28B
MTHLPHRLPTAWTWVPPPGPAAPGLTLVAAATRLVDRARRALGLPLDGWALWRQATGGDPASAQALVRHLTPPALALARQMLRRHEDAEDAVQDAFLRLWSAQPDDQRGAQLSTYFHTIVLNRCRSHLVRQRELQLEPAELDMLQDQQQAHQQDPHTDTALTDDPGRLHTALGQLPARQRMALAMWAYADAEVDDIARALEIAPNAAHQLLFRAKRGLREALQAQDAP